MKIKNFVLSAGVTLFTMPLAACSDPMPIFECERVLQASVKSENAEYRVATFLVQCGATTPDALWVVLAPSRRDFDFDTDKVAVFEGSQVKVAWRDRVLNITYKDATLFKKVETAHGVRIRYEELGAGLAPSDSDE